MVLIQKETDKKKNQPQLEDEVRQEEEENEVENQDVEVAGDHVNEEQDSDEDGNEVDDNEVDKEGKPVKKKKDNATKSMATDETAKGAEKKKERRAETREQSDLRSLYIGKLPSGVTKQDLKDLSENIVEVHIPQQKNGIGFAIIRFDNEADAEANLKILQTKEIKGQPLTVDFVGAKSSFKGKADKEERNNRKLFIGKLPEDVTEEELNSLSEDIVEIFISNNLRKNKKKVFAFLTFESEAKAEYNYEIVKNKKIRDQPIVVDYSGSKSTRPDPNPPKQVFVSELPLNVTIEQLAPHFKKAYQITLNRHDAYRNATINFDTAEDAKEANNGAKDVTILDQKIITVLRKEWEPHWKIHNFEGHGDQFRGREGNKNNFKGHGGQFRKRRGQSNKFGGHGGQFRGWEENYNDFGGHGGQFRGWEGNYDDFGGYGSQFRGWEGNYNDFGGLGGQFSGRGGNNWGKRGHSGNFWGEQNFTKRMRY